MNYPDHVPGAAAFHSLPDDGGGALASDDPSDVARESLAAMERDREADFARVTAQPLFATMLKNLKRTALGEHDGETLDALIQTAFDAGHACGQLTMMSQMLKRSAAHMAKAGPDLGDVLGMLTAAAAAANKPPQA